MAIDRYGVEAITGHKQIPVRLFRDITIAHNVIYSHEQQREAMEKSIAEWTINNPEMVEILERARLEAEYERGHFIYR